MRQRFRFLAFWAVALVDTGLLIEVVGLGKRGWWVIALLVAILAFGGFRNWDWSNARWKRGS